MGHPVYIISNNQDQFHGYRTIYRDTLFLNKSDIELIIVKPCIIIFLNKSDTELIIVTPCILFFSIPDTELFIVTPCTLFLNKPDKELLS